jgi:ATP-dependent helicase/nuclease subunit B
VWRAGGDASAADRLAELDRLADRADGPLVFVAGSQIEAWEQRWLARSAERVPVVVIEPDVAAALRHVPLLAAAWPEIAGTPTDIPIADRADAVRTNAAHAPLSILCATSLEDEATAVAQQVLDWLGAGATSIALVPLDRLTARRVRALLERAQVLVRDETGWKLSTTSAAAAVMRWFDLVADDLYWRDVLDWLKSSFTLNGRPDKAREIAAIERAIRAGGAVQGVRAIRRALDELPAADGDGEVAAERAGAREVLALIETQARASRRGATLHAHALALRSALDALGMRSALAVDPVGAAVLGEIETLARELAAVTSRAGWVDFRALLAARFEEATFVDRGVESPVIAVSLAATALRRFDAALLIGADAAHLPSLPPETLFMSNAVRAELGLATVDAELREQARQLALLIANTPRVAATWRARIGDEPNSLSPLLERLQFVSLRACGNDLLHASVRATFDVPATPASRPAPRAAALLSGRVSASHAQSLVNCAYQFHARRLLGLREVDDVIELPDKRDFGEALHDVLRRFHEQWAGAPFHEVDASELAASLRQHARAVFDAQIERAPALLAFARRFDGLVEGYLAWLREHSAADWRWSAGEESLTHEVRLADGRVLELAGRIDRIDRGTGERVKVIDYKARSVADLRGGLRQAGEDIQLPFYGLLLASRADTAAYVSFDRAKEGERGVEEVAPPQTFSALVDQVSSRLHADLQRIASGAPLPAIGADSVCERCEMRGLCRRDYWHRDDEGGA